MLLPSIIVLQHTLTVYIIPKAPEGCQGARWGLTWGQFHLSAITMTKEKHQPSWLMLNSILFYRIQYITFRGVTCKWHLGDIRGHSGDISWRFLSSWISSSFPFYIISLWRPYKKRTSGGQSRTFTGHLRTCFSGVIMQRCGKCKKHTSHFPTDAPIVFHRIHYTMSSPGHV